MKRKAHPHEHQGELNIVPYLDIMVNLVMFMLMSMTGFVTFMNLNVNVPSIARSANPTPQDDQNKEKLNLSVLMSPKGFYIAAKGGTLPPGAAGIVTGAASDVNLGTPPTIPVKFGKDFEYDYDKLESVMAEIKKANPTVSQYNLTPDKTVKYDAIVKTMDMVRGTPEHPMFPDVAFAAIRKT